MYILVFIIVLSVVVLVHEFGHFLFARKAGILCHEFSIGMGPALYKVKRGETTYAIRAIPLGGYVSMAGEDPEVARIKSGQDVFLEIENGVVRKIYFYKPKNIENIVFANVIDFDLYGKDGAPLFISYQSDEESHKVKVARNAYYIFNEKQEMQIAPHERCFESKPWLNRFLTVVMGAGFNFLLAIVLYTLINLFVGIPTDEAIITIPAENSPAAILNLQENDQILAIDGTSISKWDDISEAMSKYQNGDITLKINRDGEIIEKTTKPILFVATLGISSNLDFENSTIIGDIVSNSNANKKGLTSGDEIISIQGVRKDDLNTKNIDETQEYNENVNNWYDINNVLKNFYLGERLTITYKRAGEATPISIEVNAIKALNSDNVSGFKLGISPQREFRPLKSIIYGFVNTGEIIAAVFQTLDILFNDANVSIKDLSGPVGIYDMTKTFAMKGFMSALAWTAFISANIGFVNLLPLPALDGGRLIFLIIEKIARRPISRKVEGYIHTVGFILFLGLFLYITFNDILRIGG